MPASARVEEHEALELVLRFLRNSDDLFEDTFVPDSVREMARNSAPGYAEFSHVIGLVVRIMMRRMSSPDTPSGTRSATAREFDPANVVRIAEKAKAALGNGSPDIFRARGQLDLLVLALGRMGTANSV